MTSWKTRKLAWGALLALSVTANSASAALMKFEVIPAYAPKGTDSPSWSNYVFNAIAAIPMGMNLGDRSTDPTAYERVDGPVPAHEMIYTPFHSWRGMADPNPDFVEPFRGEYGNRIHFGLHVIGSADWDFALEELTWALSSDDSSGFFDQSGDFVGTSYSPTRVGINYGADGVKGGGDDTIISFGPAIQRVNELIFVGTGDGFLSFDPAADNDQADIDQTLAVIASGCPVGGDCSVNFAATYTLPDKLGGFVEATGSVQIELIPEPTGYLLGGVGSLLLLIIRRRRVA